MYFLDMVFNWDGIFNENGSPCTSLYLVVPSCTSERKQLSESSQYARVGLGIKALGRLESKLENGRKEKKEEKGKRKKQTLCIMSGSQDKATLQIGI